MPDIANNNAAKPQKTPMENIHSYRMYRLAALGTSLAAAVATGILAAVHAPTAALTAVPIAGLAGAFTLRAVGIIKNDPRRANMQIRQEMKQEAQAKAMDGPEQQVSKGITNGMASGVVNRDLPVGGYNIGAVGNAPDMAAALKTQTEQVDRAAELAVAGASKGQVRT